MTYENRLVFFRIKAFTFLRMRHFNRLTTALAVTFLQFLITVPVFLASARVARGISVENGSESDSSENPFGTQNATPIAAADNRTEFYNHVNEALDRLIEMLYGDIEPKNEIFWEPPHSSHIGHDNALHYTNEWLVHVTGGDEEANRIAAAAGYENLGQVRQE